MDNHIIHKKVKTAHVIYGMLVSTISIFGLLFFYDLFEQNLLKTFIVVGLQYLTGAVAINLLKNIIAKLGTKRMTILALIFYGISFVGLVQLGQGLNYWWVLQYLLFYGTARGIYLSNYQLYLTTTLDLKHIGQDMGGLASAIAVAKVLVPAITGFVAAYIGESSIFFLTIAYAVIMVILYWTIPNIPYNATMDLSHALKDRPTREAMGIAIWDAIYNAPRFVWTILLFVFWNNKFDSFGIFISVITLIAAILAKLLGNKMDGLNKKEMFHKIRLLTGVVVFSRAFAGIGPMVIISDLIGRITTYLHMTIKNSYYYGWLDHKHQTELIDDREIYGYSAYDFTIGMLLILIGLVVTLENMWIIFAVFGSVLILGYLFRRKKK